MSGITKWIVIALVVFVPTAGIIYLVQGIFAHNQAVKSAVCTENLSYLAIALGKYHEANQGRLPPVYLLGPDGNRWHSWRVLILPYLSEDAVYKEYRFDEPWDGPNNSKLAHRMPKYYGCLSDAEGMSKSDTNYFAIVGPGTAFPDDGQTFPFPWANGTGLH